MLPADAVRSFSMFKAVKLIAVIGGLALSLAGIGAKADWLSTTSFTNGGFESTTGGTSGQLGYQGFNASGWQTNGYNFLFTPGSADTTGVNGQFGTLQLYGLNNGGLNALTGSPDGGNFIAADGAFNVGPITQTITGLVAGEQYQVSFYYAGAQQTTFTGDTTEQWMVSLGGSAVQSTPILNDVSTGFTGWNHEVFTFTADGSSDALSFLAAGTPNGEPPFSLLDGVSFTAVPEPASMLLMGSGLAALGIVRRRRRAAR
jgi:hypothetical protein